MLTHSPSLRAQPPHHPADARPHPQTARIAPGQHKLMQAQTFTCPIPLCHCSAAQPPGSPPGVLSTYKGGWGLTEAAARWARSSVWSRSFTVRSLADGSRNAVAMVPVLDMIDHSPSIEVVWHTGMDGSEPFQFVPLAAVPQVGCQPVPGDAGGG